MQYQLLKFISRLVCLLPYALVCVIGRGLGLLYFHLSRRNRPRAAAQAARSLGLAAADVQPVIRRLFMHLGQTLLEIMYTPTLTRDNIERFVTIQGAEHLRQAVAQGRGVVLLTAHIGNWEWLGAALAMAGFPMTTIVKPQPNDQYTRILNEYREKVGLEVFNRGTSEIILAARALKRGKVLGFLADQDGGRDGIFVDFFGCAASTPAGPAAFAEKFRSPVVPAFIFHRPGGGHQVEIKPPLVCEHSGDTARDVRENTRRMTKLLEDVIRRHPDEWLWFQKRWNTPYKAGE